MTARENPPDLDAEDEAILDRIWDERGQREGAVRPLTAFTDDQLQAEWDAYRAGERRGAPISWVAALRQRMRALGLRAD